MNNEYMTFCSRLPAKTSHDKAMRCVAPISPYASAKLTNRLSFKKEK